MELGRKRSHPVGTCVLGGDSEEKRDYMGRDPPQRMSGSRQMLAPSHPGILHREGEPPWLVGEPVGLTERLWKAWTPLFRNTCTLAPESVRRRRTESCISGWPVSQDCPPPAQAHVPAWAWGTLQLCLLQNAAAHLHFPHFFLSFFSFWDPYNVNASTLILTCRAFKLFSV